MLDVVPVGVDTANDMDTGDDSAMQTPAPSGTVNTIHMDSSTHTIHIGNTTHTTHIDSSLPFIYEAEPPTAPAVHSGEIIRFSQLTWSPSMETPPQCLRPTPAPVAPWVPHTKVVFTEVLQG